MQCIKCKKEISENIDRGMNIVILRQLRHMEAA